jgi:hypothetical protein
MRRFKLIIKNSASLDIHSIVDFITSINTEKSGLNYETKLIHSLLPLRNCAGSIQYSHFRTAQEIHPKAKTLSIMKHRWTVVFHIEGDFVVVDRILSSSNVAG